MGAGELSFVLEGVTPSFVLHYDPIATNPSKYEVAEFGRRIWDGGERVWVSAPGDTVPPFDASAEAPDPVRILSPPYSYNCPAGLAPCPLAVDRGKDLSLGWTHGTHGAVRATLSATSPDGGDGDAGVTVVVQCWFPMAADGGVVPASALAHLPPRGTGTIILTGSNDRASQLLFLDGGVVRFELENDTQWDQVAGGYRVLVLSN